MGLPSLAVTIGTLTLYRGIAHGILPTDTIGGFPTGLASIGVVPIPHTHIPYSIAFFLALAVVFGIVLHATPLGRAIFAVGAGREAAFFAGIRVKRIKFWLFVLSGTLSGFAGVLWTLRFASARYDAGGNLWVADTGNDRVQTNFAKLGSLTFEEPDLGRFPALKLARRAGEVGGTMPAVLNAANEVAVEAFCNCRISFEQISQTVASVMERHRSVAHPSLDEILSADTWARAEAAR